VIVPVPLHQTRLKSRGFNQADVVAGMVAGVCGLPIVDKALVRTAHSEKYRAGLDAKGRQDTVTKSFAVRYEQLIAGDDVLLVDDVYTTGATVAACTEELLLAGAQSVSILTIARSYLWTTQIDEFELGTDQLISPGLTQELLPKSNIFWHLLPRSGNIGSIWMVGF
jgi:orotate phosphoribosyltransferase